MIDPIVAWLTTDFAGSSEQWPSCKSQHDRSFIGEMAYKAILIDCYEHMTPLIGSILFSHQKINIKRFLFIIILWDEMRNGRI